MLKKTINKVRSFWYFPGIKTTYISPQKTQVLTGRPKYASELTNLKNKKIIIFGDGYGWFAHHALSKGAKLVHSLDLAEPSNLVQKLSKKKNFQHFQMSLLKFVPKVKYDVAVFLEVLEHLPVGTEQKAFRVMYTSLSSKGVLIFSTPFKSYLSYLADPAALLGHRHYSQKRLETLMNKAGFKNIIISRGGYMWQAIDLLSLYFSSIVLKKTYKSALIQKVDREYPHNKGITIFAVCYKSTK